MLSSDRGSATAETAVVLPVLLVVLSMAVYVLVCVSAQLRCTDAAGLGARAAARGDAPAAVAQTAWAAAPPGADVQVATVGEQVQVVVRVRVGRLGGVLSRLPGVLVSGRAVAAREDQVGAP